LNCVRRRHLRVLLTNDSRSATGRLLRYPRRRREVVRRLSGADAGRMALFDPHLEANASGSENRRARRTACLPRRAPQFIARRIRYPKAGGPMAMLPRRAALFLLPIILRKARLICEAQASGPGPAVRRTACRTTTALITTAGPSATPPSSRPRRHGDPLHHSHGRSRQGQLQGQDARWSGLRRAGHAGCGTRGTGTSGKYNIKVWCPESAGEHPTRNDSPSIDTYEQQAQDYATLEGKDAHEHPDADLRTGSGTETIVWQLRR
jgi:hypothetical protein